MPFTPPTVPSANPEDKTPQTQAPPQATGLPRATLLDPAVAGKIQTLLKSLTLAATNLNTASDGLGKAVTLWDALLKNLNLGIEAWVDTSSGDFGVQWWDRGIGYTQINDKWGLALRPRESNDPEHVTGETWPFNQAPRWLRIEGVTKLPELLEALLKQTEDTTHKLLKQTGQTLAMAEVAVAAVKKEGGR